METRLRLSSLARWRWWRRVLHHVGHVLDGSLNILPLLNDSKSHLIQVCLHGLTSSCLVCIRLLTLCTHVFAHGEDGRVELLALGVSDGLDIVLEGLHGVEVLLVEELQDGCCIHNTSRERGWLSMDMSWFLGWSSWRLGRSVGWFFCRRAGRLGRGRRTRGLGWCRWWFLFSWRGVRLVGRIA